MIYLHERVMPRAEPSADCWDWPICTLGQRSGGRGLGNLTGRDWSLMGRHHLGRSKRNRVCQAKMTDSYCTLCHFTV